MKFKELYFHIVAIAVGLSFLTSTAFASEQNRNIRDVYKTVTRSVPYTEQVCMDVQVPIYGGGGFDQGDAIVGGIVGGLLGSQIGKGNGNKAATGAGAIAGAIIGGKKEDKIVGYKQERRCTNETRYTTTSEEVYSHSEVTFWYEGRRRTLTFQK